MLEWFPVYFCGYLKFLPAYLAFGPSSSSILKKKGKRKKNITLYIFFFSQILFSKCTWALLCHIEYVIIHVKKDQNMDLLQWPVLSYNWVDGLLQNTKLSKKWFDWEIIPEIETLKTVIIKSRKINLIFQEKASVACKIKDRKALRRMCLYVYMIELHEAEKPIFAIIDTM